MLSKFINVKLSVAKLVSHLVCLNKYLQIAVATANRSQPLALIVRALAGCLPYQGMQGKIKEMRFA